MNNSFSLVACLRKIYKDKPRQFNSVASGVNKRLQENVKCRKSTRSSILDNGRHLSRDNSPAPDIRSLPKLSRQEQRLQQLQKWKEEKIKKKQEIAKQKKKPFIVCAPSTSKGFLPPPTEKVLPSTSGRVTRSQTAKTGLQTEKKPILKNASTKTQSFAPKNAKFRPPVFANIPELPKFKPWIKDKKDKKNNKVFEFKPILANSGENSKIIQTRNQMTRQINTTSETSAIDTRNKTKQENAKSNYKNNLEFKKSQPITNKTRNKTETVKDNFKNSLKKNMTPLNPGAKLKETPNKSTLPKVGSKKTPKKSPAPKSESSMELKLRSPKSPTDTQIDAPITPEKISEMVQTMSPFIITSRGKDNARKELKRKMDDGILNWSEAEMDSVAYFSQMLESESQRITAMCETWLDVMDQISLPDSVQELVLEATGQARLLLSSKLAQFRRLVQCCAEPAAPNAPAPRVLTADLRGFWDMLYMQIENIDMRFNKLEDLKSKNWIEEQVAVKIVPKAKAIKKKRVKSTASTGLKAMIEAARKAKKEEQRLDKVEVLGSSDKDVKTFEAGFFYVRSPVRSPAASHTPKPDSLLKTVLSNEAKKSASRNVSYAMLRSSLLNKNFDIEGVEPLPETPQKDLVPVNLSATPGRSILKSKPTESRVKKIVYFNSSCDSFDLDGDQNTLETNKENLANTPETEQNEKKSKKKSSRRDDDTSPVMTRSRLRSLNNTLEESFKSSSKKNNEGKKKALKEFNDVEKEKDVVTPKRSSRRKSINV